MSIPLHHTNVDKGVYLIVNTKTNQVYVGSTRNKLYNRFIEHRRTLIRGDHFNKKLQKSFNEHGKDSFYFKYKVIKDEDSILRFEQRFYNIYKPYYNIATNMMNGGKPNKGIKLTDEWKENLVKSRKGYKHSREVLETVVNNNKNNACKLTFTKDSEVLNFNSFIEASEYFNVSVGCIRSGNSRFGKWRGWIITIKKHQKKKVKLSKDGVEIVLNSTLEADRYLNMWRGATSFYYKRDGKINEYNIDYID